MDQTEKRHCWECRRRCLVCDSTKPSCKRCTTSGTRCPGYDSVKPARIRWVEPGRVTSRDRRKPKRSLYTSVKEKGKGVMNAQNSSSSMPVICAGLPPVVICADAAAVPLVQAAEYFNACIYKDLKPVLELGQNPHIYELSASIIHNATSAPQFLQHGMYCIILSHRMNRIRKDPQAKRLNEKFYLHRGVAIRSLSKHLDAKYDGMDNVIMAGILMLLLVDIQHGTLFGWRCHLEQVQKLISRRGGFHALVRFDMAEPLLLSIWFLAIIGNTTCPAADLGMTRVHLEASDFMLEKYDYASFPVGMCPQPLFIEIVRINHLRMRAVAVDAAEAEETALDAYRTLDRIHAFSPILWTESRSLLSRQDWMRVSSAYQTAVALYCILALQSASLIPETPSMRSQCAEHGHHLQSVLVECLASSRTKRFMVWPLVVLGVEAVHKGAAPIRAFVADRLPELSCDLGTSVPLTAKAVLEAFWASGNERWDDCFDRQYIFTTQIAPDTSQLFPLYQRAAMSCKDTPCRDSALGC
ncbi:hypothetical protein PFICI_07555 [Pestalotiopsis fici W106-1]|uniref:Zn(2)-C6 fungal-type domain-containing protein n=1 Tax=Pestalotiopsis fici (strain W106-1 / CGMCC3.15140) TaxID=1229662 RepID=W3X4C3_PESFW|nr:uncharacterized protein PFICI_07555 [Pestalotiopsis fici W106-1]ETS80026.1 hypothetical protein PFICI_07555 [Pestalotiopsis fici W106-1]